MSEKPQRIDPVTAERLVRGAGSGAPVDSEPVAELLAAAAGPARRDELAGEAAAVMAFRDARLAPAPKSRRRSMLKSASARLAFAKAAGVLAAAVVGSGGIAFAATGGHIPGTSTPNDHPAAVSSSAAASTHATASTRASRPVVASTHSAAASHRGEAAGSPSPNLRGLCTAFRARADHDRGKALANPAFKALIEKAGGKSKVASYCATLLDSPSGRSSKRPSDASTHATSHPTRPDTRPSTPSHPAPSTTNTHIP